MGEAEGLLAGSEAPSRTLETLRGVGPTASPPTGQASASTLWTICSAMPRAATSRRRRSRRLPISWPRRRWRLRASCATCDRAPCPCRRLAIVRARVHDDSGRCRRSGSTREGWRRSLSRGRRSAAGAPATRGVSRYACMTSDKESAGDRRFRACQPGRWRMTPSAAPGARRPGAARHPGVPDPPPAESLGSPRLESSPLKGDASRTAPPALARRGGVRAPAIMLGRACSSSRPASSCRRQEREDDTHAHSRPQRASSLHSGRAAVQPDCGPGGAIRELDADLGASRADGTAAPRRRRIGEDGRRGLFPVAGGRGRLPRRAHGAHGDARRAALPHGGRAPCSQLGVTCGLLTNWTLVVQA